MSDIHNTQQRLESAVKNLEKSGYSKEELQALKDFKLQLESEGLGAAKVQKYLSNFSTLSENIDFNLLDPDKKDLKQLVVKINNNRLNDHEYSVWSIKEFKVTLNRFYKWHLGEDTEILDFMTTQVSESDKPMTSPDELPQPSDVKKLVKTREKIRDQALIFLTWDTGGRIGEILNIKWKDITFTENGAKIRFRHSKSKPREIPIFESVEHLRKWKEKTEFNNRDDYVFVKTGKRGINKKTYGDQLNYRGAKKVFDRALDDVEGDFKGNPHAYRKARATYLASQGMNSAQLCEYFGWTSFSTAKHYIRMAQKDLDNAIMQIQGIEPEEEEEVQSLRPIRCGNCEEVNPATRDYCQECNQLISEHKELIKEKVKNDVKHEVKNDVIKTLLNEHGIPEEAVENSIKENVEARMSEKGFL